MMKEFRQKLSVSILILLIFSELTVLASDPVWLKQLKQVKPLGTTRQDVEKLFGKQEKEIPGPWYLHNVYNTKYGKWRVMYSSGKCSEQKTEGLDIERDVLINILFIPKKRIKFSSLNLDISRFSQYQESDTDNVFFTDNEEGIQYTVSYDIVSAVKISPTKNQLSLLCRNQKK